MNHVETHVHPKVTTNGPRVGVPAVRCSNELASNCDRFNAFPSHANNRTGGDEFDEAREEGALFVDVVMSAGDFFAWNHGLQSNEFEAFALKSSKNFTDKTALHAVGFDHNVGCFHGVHRVNPKVTRLRALLSDDALGLSSLDAALDVMEGPLHFASIALELQLVLASLAALEPEDAAVLADKHHTGTWLNLFA